MSDAEHPALHADRPHAPMALDEGVLQIDPFAKYAVAFSQDVARPLHARQFGPQPADLHLLGACWFGFFENKVSHVRVRSLRVPSQWSCPSEQQPVFR